MLDSENDHTNIQCSLGWLSSLIELHCYTVLVFLLVASAHLKNVSQIGSFPQVGMNIKNISRFHATSRPAEAAQHGLTTLGLHRQRQVQEIALPFDRPDHYLTKPHLNSFEEIWNNR